MVTQNKIQLNIFTFIWITKKNNVEDNEMKLTIIYCSLKEICRANSQYNIIKKTIFDIVVNNQLLQTEKQKKTLMDDYNKTQETSYKSLSERDSLNERSSFINSKRIEEQLDKENYFKTFNYNVASGCVYRNDGNNNKSRTTSIRHGDNIEREEELNIVAEKDSEVQGEEEDDISSEAREDVVANDLPNNYTQSVFEINEEPIKEWSKEDKDVDSLKTEATPSQPLAAIVEAQTIATAHTKNVTQHLHQRHLARDYGEQILRGQQINVHNILDVAGSLCAGPMGALCDMAASTKLDFTRFGDLKDHTQGNQDFLAKKYYHPLHAHGVCRWPGCELPLDDMASFVKTVKKSLHHRQERKDVGR